MPPDSYTNAARMRARQRPKRIARIRDHAAEVPRVRLLPPGLPRPEPPGAHRETHHRRDIARRIRLTEVSEPTQVRPVNSCLTFALSAADPPCQAL